MASGWRTAHCRSHGAMRLRRAVLGMVVRHPKRIPAPIAYELLRSSGKPGFIPALSSLTGYPLRERLHGIACPTLVVWGANDRIVPVRDAAVFAAEIPGARKVVFAETGHVPMIERPARFNRLLAEFLGEPEPLISS